MPRKLKPYKIKELNLHKFGIKTIVYLDRNTNPAVFYANVNGARVGGSSEDECVENIKEEARRTLNLEWRQIIKVHIPGDDLGPSTSVSLRVSRHEIAEKPDGEYAEREFRVPTNDPDYDERSETSDFVLQRRERMQDISEYYGPTETQECNGYSTCIIPYTVDSWSAIKMIEQAIKTLRERLMSIVGNEDALRQIHDGSVKLLGG
jgi:hypothetical protein